jgi:hypothetical protein
MDGKEERRKERKKVGRMDGWNCDWMTRLHILNGHAPRKAFCARKKKTHKNEKKNTTKKKKQIKNTPKKKKQNKSHAHNKTRRLKDRMTKCAFARVSPNVYCC